MNHSYNFSISRMIPGFLFLVSLLVSSNLFAAEAYIRNASLVDCHQDFCVRLSSKELQTTFLGPHYSFAQADIEITSPNKPSQNRVFKNFEGYFDPKKQSFILRKPGHGFEYIIETKDHKVFEFPKS